MKKSTRHRHGILFLLLAVSLFLGNKVLACVLPAMDPMNMDETQAMSCCEDQCRQETTPEEAQNACDQSHAVSIQQDMVHAGALSVLSLKYLPYATFSLFAAPPPWGALARSSVPRVHSPPDSSYASHRYILTQSFLI